MKQCSKCGKDFTPDAGFEYQKMCGQCFAKVKENSRSPPRSLPNSGVGIALLDPSGTKLAPALVASKVDLNRQPRLTDFFEERAKLLEKAWFRVGFLWIRWWRVSVLR